ncbi:MAG: putative hydrolase, partial [Devosia sp.]|nr:putative hydrolase [Devosia sp.]
GESDRIATPAYGRVMSEAFGDGRFALVEKAGHLPQVEQPEATFALIDAFIASTSLQLR